MRVLALSLLLANLLFLAWQYWIKDEPVLPADPYRGLPTLQLADRTAGQPPLEPGQAGTDADEPGVIVSLSHWAFPAIDALSRLDPDPARLDLTPRTRLRRPSSRLGDEWLALFGLIEMFLFIITVLVVYAYVWRRRGLEWE